MFETERPWIVDVIIFTRHWIHYGSMIFVFFVVAVAAIAGVLQNGG
jgi:hypothetical protein